MGNIVDFKDSRPCLYIIERPSYGVPSDEPSTPANVNRLEDVLEVELAFVRAMAESLTENGYLSKRRPLALFRSGMTEAQASYANQTVQQNPDQINANARDMRAKGYYPQYALLSLVDIVAQIREERGHVEFCPTEPANFTALNQLSRVIRVSENLKTHRKRHSVLLIDEGQLVGTPEFERYHVHLHAFPEGPFAYGTVPNQFRKALSQIPEVTSSGKNFSNTIL